jgi:hypothetical protein
LIAHVFYFRFNDLIEHSAFAESIGRYQEIACLLKNGREVDTRLFSNTHGNVGERASPGLFSKE